MSGAESDSARVHLHGNAMVTLVDAVRHLATAEMGAYAVVGGVAVAVRLGQAHRATSDVDAVVDGAQQPSALDVLRGLPDAQASDGELHLAGAKVEVLPVGPMPGPDALEGLAGLDALFVVGHAWALDTATVVTVTATDGEQRAVATARFASPASLLAMKLHAVQDRSAAQDVKRGGDAWDIHQLLVHRNRGGALSGAIAAGPAVLRSAVVEAVTRVLVEGAGQTRAQLRRVSGAAGTVTSAELRQLGEDFLRRLGR